MKELRIHGRGGQGAAAASRILSTAFVHEGKYAAGFPVFGVERRGAPVTAFVRFDEHRIRENTGIYYPDCLIVIDPGLVRVKRIFDGIKEGGVVVVNAPEKLTTSCHEGLGHIGAVDATGIAVEEIGTAITNTCMLGAFARTTGWVGLDSVLSALEEYFSGEKLKRNVRTVQRGFEETHVVRF